MRPKRKDKRFFVCIRARSVVLVACVLLGSITTAWAAELMLTQAALTGAVPFVVNETDGTTIHGAINQITPELLYVTPAPKPNAKNPSPATQPTEIPWKQIRTVSGGLSARLALDMWIAQHAGHLCPTCHGERTVWCPVCKGTQHDPASATTCPTCKGELLLQCTTPKVVKGQVSCPNSCLKLTVGNWSKHPDGLMWRTWHFGNGTETFSEHHLGDVMALDPKALPPISDGGKCPICGGSTMVDDLVCFGTGLAPCRTCLARKTAPPCPNQCDNGRVICPTCNGTGLAEK